MHNNDEADLRAQVRSEITTDQLPPPLWYLPKMANLARDIESLAHKVNGVPGALSCHIFDRLAQDIEGLSAATRENLEAYGEPSTVIYKELENLMEALEAASNAGLHTDSLPIMRQFLEELEKHLQQVYAQIGVYFIDTLSLMEWNLKPEYQHDDVES